MWPKSTSEISVEFLSSILGKPVKSFSCENTAIQGGCSIMVCVSVEFEGFTFAPMRLFFKFPLPPADPDRNIGINRAELVRVAGYRKEIAFYRYARQHASSLIPPLFFAEIDESEQDEFLLVLGEFGHALDQLKDCPRDISQQVVSQLAHLHAPFVDASPEELKEAGLEVCLTPSHTLISRVSGQPDATSASELLDYCCKNFTFKFHDFSAVMYAIGDAEIVEMLPHALEVVQSNQINALIEEAFNAAFLQPTFKTLLHGDFRMDNLLSSDAEGVKIIDYQAMCFGHPCYDLAQFLCQSHDNLSSELFDELLTIYYNTLCERNPAVGSKSTLPQLKQDVQAATVFQILMLTLHVAPLRAAISAETGKLPDTFGRFLPLLVSITRRGLRVFLQERRKFY